MTFIQNNLKSYPISQLCSALKFPRSTYYKALVCVPSNRKKEYEAFSRQVKEADDDSKQRYGAVKICHSQKGNPYNNACIESFPPVRKKEESYLHTYQDFKESRKAIFESIASWYNRKRIHSAIDSMTPQQKEDEELKKTA